MLGWIVVRWSRTVNCIEPIVMVYPGERGRPKDIKLYEWPNSRNLVLDLVKCEVAGTKR